MLKTIYVQFETNEEFYRFEKLIKKEEIKKVCFYDNCDQLYFDERHEKLLCSILKLYKDDIQTVNDYIEGCYTGSCYYTKVNLSQYDEICIDRDRCVNELLPLSEENEIRIMQGEDIDILINEQLPKAIETYIKEIRKEFDEKLKDLNPKTFEWD